MDSKSLDTALESDPRFPSGKWTGFWLQKIPNLGRQWMDLDCVFKDGKLKANGRDIVGAFIFMGSYSIETGKCDWVKQYLGQHPVDYHGFNEGKGIWGTWGIIDSETGIHLAGGFHIWPEGQGWGPADSLSEELDLPLEQVPELVPA